MVFNIQKTKQLKNNSSHSIVCIEKRCIFAPVFWRIRLVVQDVRFSV